ncbi:hypothetical protein Pint_25950 [Pistacia integerrima]|uniref:Uncharacterized protein n=1 Tax=Pistacia integerrima TaxID=434235 RepID=A0ACC0YF12_9ROSI|nr:hypothetical protein Pint_25950 [Pistacia integerrima]
MASSSSLTLQASPNQQVQSCLRNPLLFDPLGLELSLSIWEMKRRFPVLLTRSKLEYLEKCPCELWKLFQPGGPSNHSGSAHVTSGCFCNQAEKRPTVAASKQPLPSIQELCHKRRHSMQPVLENMVLGTRSLDELIHMAILSQLFQEHTIASLFSQAIAEQRSMAANDELITATSCQFCGKSSQPSHASPCETSFHDHSHTQVLDQNSSILTLASPADTVLNITPPLSESRRDSFSIESREEEPLLNRPRLTETFLVITTQAALTLLTVGSGGNNGNSLSQNAKILVRSAAACNIIGYVCCLLGIIVCGRKPGIAARITTGIGYIATVYGFVAVMGMLLRDNLKLRITAAACAASFPGLVYVFFK